MHASTNSRGNTAYLIDIQRDSRKGCVFNMKWTVLQTPAKISGCKAGEKVRDEAVRCWATRKARQGASRLTIVTPRLTKGADNITEEGQTK